MYFLKSSIRPKLHMNMELGGGILTKKFTSTLLFFTVYGVRPFRWHWVTNESIVPAPAGRDNT